LLIFYFLNNNPILVLQKSFNIFFYLSHIRRGGGLESAGLKQDITLFLFCKKKPKILLTIKTIYITYETWPVGITDWCILELGIQGHLLIATMLLYLQVYCDGLSVGTNRY
jgi:hypothetical protein